MRCLSAKATEPGHLVAERSPCRRRSRATTNTRNRCPSWPEAELSNGDSGAEGPEEPRWHLRHPVRCEGRGMRRVEAPRRLPDRRSYGEPTGHRSEEHTSELQSPMY